MANGRNRRQTRSALNRRARLQRFPGIGSYDYGPAAAITTNFGQVARDNLSDFRNVQETALKARERIDAAQKEASEAQDYDMTGIADVDKATMSLAADFRDHLREERNQIGKLQDDGSVYTISDFVAFKNNVINNSKIWKGHPELINKTLERMRDDKVDPLAIEAYAETAGLILNPGGAYNVGSSRDGKNKGNITISGKNPDGTEVEFDLKNFAVNGVQEFKTFDATKDIKDFQDLYAGTKQSFEIDGQMYTVREVMDNPLLFTKHIQTEPAEFEKAKETHLDNFMNDDLQVLSYLRQMGKKVEYSHTAYDALSDDQKKSFLADFPNMIGAAHGLEIAFLTTEYKFGPVSSYVYPKTDERDQMEETFLSAWSNFAKEGVPIIENASVQWERYESSKQTFVVLDNSSQLRLMSEIKNMDEILDFANSNAATELEKCILVRETVINIGRISRRSGDAAISIQSQAELWKN